jgi:hypothetical protein
MSFISKFGILLGFLRPWLKRNVRIFKRDPSGRHSGVRLVDCQGHVFLEACLWGTLIVLIALGLGEQKGIKCLFRYSFLSFWRLGERASGK